MKRYPEYFVGGPLDGQDKNERFPSHPEWMPIRVDDSTNGLEVHVAESLTPIHVIDCIWHYYPHKLRLGGEVLTYWFDDRLISREVVALRFWELILKPHEIKVQLKKEAS